MGRFIVFEGIDGSGTTTISKEVAKRIGAIWTCEPTSGPIGTLIRKCLKGEDGPFHSATMMNLFQADRIEHSLDIAKMLKEGNSVVCDRYHVSTLVYQSLHRDFKQAEATLKKICRRVFIHEIEYLCMPEFIFFIDVTSKTAKSRRKIRSSKMELYDDEWKQKMLVRLYSEYFRVHSKNSVRIDGEASRDECVEECLIHLLASS